MTFYKQLKGLILIDSQEVYPKHLGIYKAHEEQ